jgi:hypothetical protein
MIAVVPHQKGGIRMDRCAATLGNFQEIAKKEMTTHE